MKMLLVKPKIYFKYELLVFPSGYLQFEKEDFNKDECSCQLESSSAEKNQESPC